MIKIDIIIDWYHNRVSSSDRRHRWMRKLFNTFSLQLRILLGHIFVWLVKHLHDWLAAYDMYICMSRNKAWKFYPENTKVSEWVFKFLSIVKTPVASTNQITNKELIFGAELSQFFQVSIPVSNQPILGERPSYKYW